MSTPSKTRDLVVCTCTSMGCKLRTFTNSFGLVQPGKLVPRSTCTTHRRKDREAGAAASEPLTENIPQSPELSSTLGGEGDEGIRGKAKTYTINTMKASLSLVVCALASWLHVACGLSRAGTGRVLKVLEVIITMAMEFGTLLAASSYSINQANVALPHDINRAMSLLSIEPIITRSVCCPKCFKQYAFNGLPEVCHRRETPRSKECGARLLTTRSTRAGPRLVPSRLYNTQDFESWLQFFLSRPGIEDLIDKSYEHQPSTETMHSMWDSPAWQSLGNFTTTRGNLTFSFYIDWFNPFTNKIAGKAVSCGAIMMFCLNLPYDMQYLPENTYFAGLTPPPKEPSVTTITALADPIVDRLEDLWRGKRIRTYRHPDGTFKRVGLLAAIGDLLAMRKALGFAGIASKDHFCSFCTLPLAEIDNLDFAFWQRRDGIEVLKASALWRNSTTKKERKELFQKHGVRWSSLHRLTYRDPVRHTVLGVMHNWIEGVLQHHARVIWGIGITASTADEDTNEVVPTADEETMEMDVDMEDLDAELTALYQESQQFQDTPSHAKRLRSEASLRAGSPMDGYQSSDDGDFEPDSDSDDDVDNEAEDEQTWIATCIFKSEDLAKIHHCLANTTIPSSIERPPTNLGDKSHGKLKADHWLLLFTVFLPLVIPEVWNSRRRRQSTLLTNFHQLITCTNIVCSLTVTEAAAESYLSHYIQYRQTLHELFPGSKPRPNHHYAMHNYELMKFWGPLMLVSEFPYERHNGRLQKIKTNGHIWEMDYTMLRQICRRGRLSALLRDHASTASERLHDQVKTALQFLAPLSSSSQTNTLGENLSLDIYSLILAYINSTPSQQTQFRSFDQMPHPLNASVLPRFAIEVKHLEHNKHHFSVFSSHPGNSSISFTTQNGNEEVGLITSMWKMKLDDTERTFILVNPHNRLSPLDEPKSPYTSMPGLLCLLVYSSTASPVVIEAGQLRSHIPFYDRPSGTFGIQSATRILINSLNRSRT